MARASLAYALKAKNRIVKRVNDLHRRIQAHNVVTKGTERPFDLQAAMSDLNKEVEKLIQIKTAISTANAPIQEKIFRLAELRGHVSFLQSISTENPFAYAMYSTGNVVESDAQFGAGDLAKLVEQTEAQIDALQDEIDRFNAVTEIDLPED